jgi:hypothetical protein
MEGMAGAAIVEEVNGAAAVNVVNGAGVNRKLQFEYLSICMIVCIVS